jgi:hypothetical protein
MTGAELRERLEIFGTTDASGCYETCSQAIAAAALLTAQPEDMGEPCWGISEIMAALVEADSADNGMTLAFNFRASLTRHPTKEAENG